MTLRKEIEKLKLKYKTEWVDELPDDICLIDTYGNSLGDYADCIQDLMPPDKGEGSIKLDWYFDGTFMFYRKQEE